MGRRKKLSDAEIVQAIKQLIADAEGYDADELASMREQALNYYYNRDKAAPHVPGRSKQQSSDVADMVEAVVSQVLPAFESDSVAVFPPLNEDDVDQARLETDAVTYVIMQQNNGHYELQQALRDALLLRNGVMKVWLDENTDVETAQLTEVTEQQRLMIKAQSSFSLDNTDNGHTVVDESENEDVAGTWDMTLKVKRTERQLKSKAVDIANFYWERDLETIYIQDARFIAERSEVTRSELLEMGYPKSKVMALNYGGKDNRSDQLARNQHSYRHSWKGQTDAEDIIEFWEAYLRLDADGDGVAELIKVCYASDTLLDKQPIEIIPYAAGTPFLQPHRFNGLGLFDKLQNIQDSKTAALRQLLDNQNNANNSRTLAVDGAVNIDDLTNSRPGGVVRVRSADAVVPFPFNDVGASAQATLDYLDKVRSERGGASLDMQSAEMQIAGETAHGVERQMSAKEQLAAMMTRTLAETLLRQLYLLVHKALTMYVPDDLQFQVMDEFVMTNPSQWAERKQVQIKAGLSMAERMRKRQALEAVIMRQDALKQQGVYVSQTDVYNAHLDWTRCQSVENPERYFTDPNSEEAMQAAQAQQQEAQKQEQYQMLLMQLQKEVEDRKAANADAKVFEDSRQFDLELAFKYWAEMMGLAAKETEQILTLVQGQLGNDGNGGVERGQTADAANQ